MSIFPLRFLFVFKKNRINSLNGFFKIRNKKIFDILQFCIKRLKDQFYFIMYVVKIIVI